MTRRRPPSASRLEKEGADERSGSERLQKVLAAAGLGSRRDCEELIVTGRVEVDRQIVTELGTKVNPLEQEIRVDGVSLHRPKKVYFALNKPPGVVSTNFDPSHRSRVIDLIPTDERVFPVGRLDRGSEGLILVTNDGELANRVTHPRYGLEKTYFVRVAGNPEEEDLLKLRRGVRLAEGVARVVSIKVRKRYRQHTDLEIVLNEGRNREIRRILAKVGHKVMLLRRLAVGPIRLGELPLGAARRLLPQEVQLLLEATQKRRDARPAKKDEAGGPRKPRPEGAMKKSPPPARPSVAPKPAPTPTSYSSAPPKLDLATLLNPHAAPKAPVLITPPTSVPQAPAIGEVIPYDDATSPADKQYTPPPRTPRHRPGLEQKLAEEREEAPSFLPREKKRPGPRRAADDKPRDGIVRGGSSRKMPRGLKADARRVAKKGPPPRKKRRK